MLRSPTSAQLHVIPPLTAREARVSKVGEVFVVVGFVGLLAGLLAQQLIVLLAGVPLFVGGVILHAPKLRELREQRRSEREHKQIERRSVAHPRTASALGLILSIPLGIAFFELARWLMTP